MSAVRFSGVPESYSHGIWGPLFIVKERKAPEGKGRESGHMVASGEAMSGVSWRMLGSPISTEEGSLDPLPSGEDILNLFRPTTCVPSQNATGTGHYPSPPSAVAWLQEG